MAGRFPQLPDRQSSYSPILGLTIHRIIVNHDYQMQSRYSHMYSNEKNMPTVYQAGVVMAVYAPLPDQFIAEP